MSGRKNSKKYFSVLLVAASLVLAPVNFSFFLKVPLVAGESIPPEEISDSVEWSENRTVQSDVYVDAGATLTIKKGVILEFDGKVSINVYGNLVIEGTPEQPVVLKKKGINQDDFYTVRAISSGSITVRNADILGGGRVQEVFLTDQPSFLLQALADWSFSGALGTLAGGSLDIEGVNFHDNALAVYAGRNSATSTKVWRSKFSHNGYDFVNQSSQDESDFRYDWWGDTAGPGACVTSCDYPGRTYETIIGAVNFADWAKSEYFKDPVVIIPGIMGSWRWTRSSPLVLDPLGKTYDGLVATFEKNGYVKDKDLFLFPYEWRASNVITAHLLKTKIAEIKDAAKWPRVDIVAHSMGGLVAREYIETLHGGSNVDQLITLGTPHEGSPQSYLTWDGGEFGVKFRDLLLKGIFHQEAEENGYDSIFSYIRKAPITSVRELLPTYSYLKEVGSGAMRTYPDIYPRNSFLENLKTEIGLDELKPVLFTNIVGKTKNDETIEKIRVGGASVELLNDPAAIVPWGHGKPDGFDNIFGGDRGLELGVGDGTVPLDSAQSTVADETIELIGRHGDLPSLAAKTVYKTLQGKDVTIDVEVSSPPTAMLLFMPFSPVDIQIISPSGKRVGKNFETGGIYGEIADAFYTGYDTKNEFVTIPNPEQGKYKILTQGTGKGDYRVEATSIRENADGQTRESIATVTGVADTNTRDEKAVEVQTAGDVIVSNQDTTPPATTATLSGMQGTNGWYTSALTVTLTATDNEGGSGVAGTEYSLDNGVTWQPYSGAFVFSKEGVIAMQYRSADKAGNKEETKTQAIKIDQTAPEGRITFNPLTEKLDITGQDNLSQNVTVMIVEDPKEMTVANPKFKKIKSWMDEWLRKHKQHLPDRLAILTDEAGHTTSIAFEKTRDQRLRIFLKVQALSYDGTEKIQTNTLAQYKWSVDNKKQYRMLATRLAAEKTNIESHYIPKRNETWIMERPRGLAADENDDDSDRRPVLKRLPGLVVPYLETLQGKLRAGY